MWVHTCRDLYIQTYQYICAHIYTNIHYIYSHTKWTSFWFLSFLSSAAQSPPWACNLVTCLSKEREAHLPSRASQNFWSLLVNPWVSENVLSLPQILAVCHWIALSFSVHKKVLHWQVTPCTDRSLSLWNENALLWVSCHVDFLEQEQHITAHRPPLRDIGKML